MKVNRKIKSRPSFSWGHKTQHSIRPTREAYGWGNDFWHDEAMHTQRKKEFANWIESDESLMAKARRYYLDKSKTNILGQLIIDFLEESGLDVDEAYDMWYKDAEAAIDDIGYIEWDGRFDFNESIRRARKSARRPLR
jgi:hypothetical protein